MMILFFFGGGGGRGVVCLSWTALILAHPSGLLFTKHPVYENKHLLSWTLQQVRNFLESTLVDLRHLWMKRIGYQMCFACPCERVCEEHKLEACSSDMCIHFLHMDECLANKVRKCSNPPTPPTPQKQTNNQTNKKIPMQWLCKKKNLIVRHVHLLEKIVNGAWNVCTQSN